MRQRFVRSLTAAGATAALMAAGIGAASAHVHVHPDSTEAGESALLTFETSHGCKGSPTTAITVTLPDQITDATPTAHPGWKISKVTEDFAEPRVLDNGTSIGSRTSQVVFTAIEPLPDGVRDTFQLTVKLPDAAGETLAFPVLQSCAEGETDWAQLPAEGQSDADLESPAPMLTVSGESGGSGAHGESGERGTEGSSGGSQGGEDSTSDVDDRDDAVDEDDVETAAIAGFAGLGAGVLGLILGAVALFRTRKA
ncbi:YcnI family protein [Arthrobacter sp. zg-Y1219]|uniref:YcnI family protein n=1 Tax=Arthrobacter sp. zg-Y1219 TaxID=3049067 RepID=UPI0024C28999|nr:YcnI family protein [Arthrobacter sp. zg-Y1219]MDK1361490.1 YcnI family protein [Arthrobacter sp. zg-Y1219]